MLKRASAVLVLISFVALLDVRAQGELREGMRAPDFKLPSIGNSKQVALRDFLNKKIVIVHFWKSK